MGQMQFDRQTIISATTNKSIKIITSAYNSPLAAGGAIETHSFLSPTNTISRIIGLYIGWNKNTTSGITGNRYTSVFVGNSGGNLLVPYMYAQTSVINLDFEYYVNNWMLGRASGNSSSISPLPSNDSAALATILFNMMFDDVEPLTIQFSHTNSNNSADSNQRTITLFTVQEVVAR